MTENIPLARLLPSSDNPRRELLPNIDELATSIADIGILQPLLVRPVGPDVFEVVGGHRRFAAAQRAGLTEVLCVVREMSERQAAEIRLVENLQRVDLTPLEEAVAYARLSELGASQREIAAKVGRTQAHVSHRTALLRLPRSVQADVDNGVITVAEARELIKLANEPERLMRAIESSRDGGGMARAVSRELWHRDRERTRAEAVERAKAGEVPYVELTPNERGSLCLPQGVRWLNQGVESLEISTEQHMSEPCHAVAVTNNGRVAAVCMEPERHGAPHDEEAEEARLRMRLALDPERVELDEATRVREEFLSELLRRCLSRDEVTDFLVVALLRNLNWEEARRASALLGIEAVAARDDAEVREALAVQAAEGEAGQLAAGLAAAIASLESGTRVSVGPWRDLEPYFDLLERQGYEPAAAERRRLETSRESDRGREAAHVD